MILDSVTVGTTKTKIMYKAYLSYTQLKEYLSLLEESGMIVYENGTQIYKITEKGRKFLKLSIEIDDMVSYKSEETLNRITI
jgi:predicted transcriptional regulator